MTFRVAPRRGRPFTLLAEGEGTNASGHSVAGGLIEEALIFGFDWRYDLDAYVVMPDHVHLIVTPRTGWPLSRILRDIKSVSAREVNRAVGRRGSLWQDESLDHLIRSEVDWVASRDYILRNPVTAGLTDTPGAYRLSSAVTLDPAGRREELSRLLRAADN